ncbi:AHH domain-containing protein [Streptomyces sp. NPDC090298]|uniref:AHH domain-containing protein n=1 Tax=Streptomyces sp. NPDC090298 TaxID=3365959 RepID=UPI00381A8C0B
MNTAAGPAPPAAGTAAGRGTAYRRIHLPESVVFGGDRDRFPYEALLERLLLRAVADAVERDDRDGGLARPVRLLADRETPGARTEGTRRSLTAAAAREETGATPTAGATGHGLLAFAVAAPPEREGLPDATPAATGADEQAPELDHDHEQGAGQPDEGAAGKETEDGTARPAGAEGTHEAATEAGSTDGAETEPGVTVVQERRTGTSDSGTPEEEAHDAPSEGPAPVDTATAPADDDAGTDPRDEVVAGPSPVDGRAVMVIGATQLVLLGEATRHARSRSFVHAVQLGDHLFGARSFAVLEGPLGTRESVHWAVATAPTVTDEIMGRELAHWEYEGQQISTFKGFTVLPVVTTLDGHRYGVQLLWTKERGWLYGAKEEGKRWVRLSRSSPEHWLSRERLRTLAFQDLDRLVEAALAGDGDSLTKAAEQLGEMDAKAFSLVDGDTREKYLRVLVKAWTFEEQRHAIIEIMRSIEGMADLLAVRDRLIQHGLYEQLFADLGNDLWTLLVDIGKRFGDHRPFGAGEFLGLVTEAFNLGTDRDTTLKTGVEDEVTDVPDLKLMIQFEEAARAATGFVLSTLDSFKMMLTEPEKILSGLYQLARLQYLCHRSRFGDKKAQEELRELVRHIGAALVDGLRGAALLGVGPRAVTRIKWGVIIEALTWMTEIKAVVEAAVKIEKIAAVLRFLKLLKATEAELYAARFSRLASVLHGGSEVLKALKDEHEVADLLRMLPEEDGARLGAVLSEVDVPAGSTLTSLVEHPRLGPVVADFQRKAEVLHVLGLKSGGLTPELARVYGRLIGKDGFEIAEVGRIAVELKEGEGSRFSYMLEQIGLDRIGARAEVKADLLALLAAEPRRMEAVAQYGIDVVQGMHGRAAAKAEAFDTMLVRLDRIRTKEVTGDRAVGFSEFLDRLRRGDKASWRRVAPPPRPPRPPRVRVSPPLRAKASTAAKAPVLERIKQLRRRFPKAPGPDRRAMEAALEQIKRINRTDPEDAMERLEWLEEQLRKRKSKEGQLAADIAEAEAKAGRESKALHHEPDEVPPEALGVRDELRSKLTEAEEASRALAANMEAIGQHQPYGHDAHHIVAWTDRRAGPAREILEWAGVDPRADPLNGVYLPRTSEDPRIVPQALTRHQTLHTDNYYKVVTRRLVEARRTGGKEGVIREMVEIKRDLINGWKDPGPVRTPKGPATTPKAAKTATTSKAAKTAKAPKAPKAVKGPKAPQPPEAAKPPAPAEAPQPPEAAKPPAPAEAPQPPGAAKPAAPAKPPESAAPRPPRAPRKKAKKQNFAEWFEEYSPALDWLTEEERREAVEKATRPPGRRRKRAPKPTPAPAAPAPSALKPDGSTPGAPADQGTAPGQSPDDALGEFVKEAPKHARKRLPGYPEEDRKDDQER